MSKLLIILFIFITINQIGHAKSNFSDPHAALTYRIFNELRYDNTEILNQFYNEKIVFKDPISELNGLRSMKEYYKKMYKEVDSIRFDFKNYSVTNNRYFFSWDMYLKTPNLNSGEEFKVNGVSEILFEGDLVTYHRDYFDMGAFIYEKVPVIGQLVKFLKRRLEYHP